MDAPEWLTQEYMQNALRQYHKDPSLRVLHIQINPALGKGENFGGILTRVLVHYQLRNVASTEKRRFIVKTSLEHDEFSREKMKPYDVFNRELSIYANVLPKLQALLHEIHDNDKLCTQAVYADRERQAIIFEDLSELGYVMADRAKRLDRQHVELVLRKLAKYHATTAVLDERNCGSLQSYDRGFFNRYTNNYSTYFVGTLLCCANFLKQWPDFASYQQKLLALAPHYMEIGKRCFAPTPGHVNVLAHGDVWTNNVMFKYDPGTGTVVDVLLIDFQYSFWGSPAIDLHHFFNTSLQEPLRLHHQDSLVQFYHGIFADTLEKLSYSTETIPSLRQFHLHVEEKKFFALHSSCVIQPVMINEDSKDADFRILMDEDERSIRYKNNLYNNKNVQQVLRDLLPMFDRRGLLEINQNDSKL